MPASLRQEGQNSTAKQKGFYFGKNLCLSNIEVIGQSMAEIQLLPVSENKGGHKI